MRVILYTGKGGVGKTTVAAATALRSAELGYSTVVMSTDPAHSLADSFETELGNEPTLIAPNLWGQEIDVLQEMETHWETVSSWLAALMQWQGMDEVIAGEVAVLPGMEELVGLLYVSRYYEQGNYDVLIVDCAPTAETLRLLSFPEMARWYMKRLFPIERRAARALGPLARSMFNLPVPDEKVFQSVEDLYSQLDRMKAILVNAEVSSVRLVVNPEKMVVKEAQRTFTYLNLYGYSTDLVVCNRILPDSVDDSYFDAWKESQARNLQLIQECFDPIPVLRAPLLDEEVVGVHVLRRMAQALYNDQDPTRHFFQGQPQQVSRGPDGHVLAVTIPFLDREDISLIQNGGELIIQAGRYRRNIFLPRVLAGLDVKEAKKDGDTLRIHFKEPAGRGRRQGKG